MPISATGNRERGATLIELLVGLVILSVLLGAVMLVFPRTGERRTELVAERVQALIGLACERAEITGGDVGIALARHRLAFGPFDHGHWQPVPDNPAEALRSRALDDIVTLELSADDRPLALADALPNTPQLACLSTGELTPFALEVRGPENSHWRLRGDSGGHLQGQRVDAR